MFQSHIIKFCLILIYVIQILLMLYTFTLFFISKDKIKLLFIVYSAVISQIAMVMSAYYPLRSVLVFYFLFFVIIIYCIIDLIDSYKIQLKCKSLNVFIFCFVIMSFTNYCSITRGYFRNDNVNRENDRILTEYSLKIKRGEKVTEIKLHKMNDITYSGDQPYVPGQDYMLEWIYEYYDLPNSVQLIYE